jgi:hypothetical protein
MPDQERELEQQLRQLSNRAYAFLDVLQRNLDTPINFSDLKEYYPEIEWEGKVADTWKELKSQEELSPYLVDFGEAKSKVYAFVENPNSYLILVQRTESTAELLEEYAEGEAIDKKMVARWKKLAVLAGALTTSAAVGTAVYRHGRKSK